jgi:hypothetical protein
MKRPAPKPHLSSRHIARRLRALVGTWQLAGQFVGGDEVLEERGTVTFRWLEKDALLVMRTRTKVAPKSVTVMGADETANDFTMLYSDDRGVVRRCEMTLTSRRWTWARRAPGFHQRFTARLSSHGRVIRATVEKSADGRRWTRDFNLTYAKAG